MNRKVSFIQILRDMFKLVGFRFWIIVFVSFLVVFLIVQQSGVVICPNKLPQTLIDTIPEMMGFLIAGLAIIMGFNEGTLKRLSVKADDGKIPFMVIIASFSVCLLFLLISLFFSILYVNIDFACKGYQKLLSAFVLCGAIIAMESVIHVIFYLFATGTYLIKR